MGILSAILALHSIMMGKIAKTFRGNSKGQTLIEVLIALAILGIVVVAFMTALTTASRAIIVADEHTTAESLARSELEYVKKQGYNFTVPEATYDIIDIPSEIGNYVIKGLKKAGYDANYPDGMADPSYVNSHASDNIIGVFWNTTLGTTSDTDTGIQIVTVVIYHKGRENAVLYCTDFKVNR